MVILRSLTDQRQLLPSEYDTWLDREVDDPEKLQPLYQPFPADLLEMQPVSTGVNSPRHEVEDCIRPENLLDSLLITLQVYKKKRRTKSGFPDEKSVFS